MGILLCQYCSESSTTGMDGVLIAVCSTILGIIIGGGINIYRDFRKERTEIIKKKREIYRNVVSALSLFNHYSFFISEGHSINNFHNNVKNATGVLWCMKDEQKRLFHDVEKYRLRDIELRAEIFKLFADYYSFFGEDKEFEALVADTPSKIGFSELYITEQSVKDFKTEDQISIALANIYKDVVCIASEFENKFKLIEAHIKSKLPK